ncbi:MAG TPA: LysR substrate-binding domain-containing protein [Vicinamibacteria bacterium]|jgi:DNA-binding transcriptional LysR family regulator
MDVRQLEMFRAVAEEGSFTRAAQRLHVSQSAVSRQVKLLEEELGGLLLHRGGNGISLTAPGELVLKTANRVQRDLQDVVWQLSAAQKLQRGLLRLGGGMTVCLYILPRLLKRFHSRFKQVELHVASGTSEGILRLLRNHQVDLGLLTLPVVASDLEVLPVLKEEMVVVTAPHHPLARARSVEPRSLGRFPLILFEAGSNTRKVVDQFFLEAEIPAKVAMETENVEIIKAMVASGLGISLIPYAAIAKDLGSRRFAWTRVRGRRLYRETGWVYLKSDHLPRVVAEMLRVFEEMKNEFGSRPPGA